MRFKDFMKEANVPGVPGMPNPLNPNPTQNFQASNKIVSSTMKKPDFATKVGGIAGMPRGNAEKQAVQLGSQAFKNSSPSDQVSTTPTDVTRNLYSTATGGGNMRVKGDLKV